MADRTKIWIADATKRLMARKSLDKIRVTEICREAEIGRPAFYYHFKDKYDVVAWIYLRSALEIDFTSPKSAAAHLDEMREDSQFYKRAFEDYSSQNALWKYVNEYSVNKFTQEAKHRLGTDTLGTQVEFSIRLYSYGTICMISDWFQNDCTTPSETMVELMYDSMPSSLKEIFLKD